METILIVGGAGYIGSYMCKLLAGRGYRPVVLDNLSRGHMSAVRWGPLIEGDLANEALLEKVFGDYQPSAVMHFAALIEVGESVQRPGRYYANNVAATLNLLRAMVRADIRNFIFSSTCAIYGEPQRLPLDEAHAQFPVSPYGRGKLMVEQILEDFSHAYGLQAICMRYFNAAGADPDGEIGEDHRPESHLIPLVLQVALGQRDCIHIFGDDYPTEDGTCIRDYIHIHDLAEAHLLALQRLMDGKGGGAYNLGNGTGYSVRQLIETARKVTGRPISETIADRRPGDAAILVGSSEKALKELGWKPRYADLNQIVETAWRWHRTHPHGYPQ